MKKRTHRQIVAKAEVDALKRLQAESRPCLHPPWVASHLDRLK
jgi:hypothetical protein